MKQTSMVLAILASIFTTQAMATDSVAASVGSVAAVGSIPVVAVSGVATVAVSGVASASTVVAGASQSAAFSLRNVTKSVSGWTVQQLTPGGENTRVVLQEQGGTQQFAVNLPNQAVQTKGLKQGQAVQVVKRSDDVALLKTSSGDTVAILSSSSQHSTVRTTH